MELLIPTSCLPDRGQLTSLSIAKIIWTHAYTVEYVVRSIAYSLYITIGTIVCGQMKTIIPVTILKVTISPSWKKSLTSRLSEPLQVLHLRVRVRLQLRGRDGGRRRAPCPERWTLRWASMTLLASFNWLIAHFLNINKYEVPGNTSQLSGSVFPA